MNIFHKLKTPNHFKLTILAATILLFLGLSTWFYANIAIQETTKILNSSDLTQKEIWSYEGSLQWWKTVNSTTITPIATILMAIGFIGIFGPIITSKMFQRNVLKTFTENLELASKEIFELE